MEMARLSPSGELLAKPGMHVTQINFSRVLPGAIKAFHLHLNQEDVWFVPPTDRLLVGLVDVREKSPTFDQNMRFVLGANRARLLYIPRGCGARRSQRLADAHPADVPRQPALLAGTAG